MKIKKCGLAILTLLPIVFFLAGCGSKRRQLILLSSQIRVK
ncbi:hypothetical protein SDC49_01125 [Lactobacillus sp. R2/2]|nr:hypothetical protein [Lactobacillus sp. R2/2]